MLMYVLGSKSTSPSSSKPHIQRFAARAFDITPRYMITVKTGFGDDPSLSQSMCRSAIGRA